MTSNEIRKKFLDFFESKSHRIVPSAPIVNKGDPSLLFTNAGMNQFKDYFLGNKVPEVRRIADTQKCLRVSGKHNDLEEVGRDSYHHTMFEMLGNWSFGDYFKKEAIAWAWELLVNELGLPGDRLYATVFGGDKSDQLEADEEAADYWKEIIPKERVLYFGRKDNFWEMGETGPCGPCSEIHLDMRTDEERLKTDGSTLVNQDHPMVIEIWNLVFIQFNRKANGSLEELPEKHVDTGMGFERLCMAIQKKNTSYETDVFSPLIAWVEEQTGKSYTNSYEDNAKSDVAFRVLVDHIRACATTIADGQLPSNTGAGYVIRRILRRAVRYYYSFLDRKEPLLYLMIDLLSDQLGDVFPELRAQKDFIANIIHEEEKSFLRTLEGGLKRIGQVSISNGILDGKLAFELYDTYGFPIDLTRLIGEEKGWKVDEDGFDKALEEQRARSRADGKVVAGDWHILLREDQNTFIGYDKLTNEGARVLKYRTVEQKGKEVYQVVLDNTPFYAESGGQVGDKGSLRFGEEEVAVYDTQKENDLIVHFVNKLPNNIKVPVTAKVNAAMRRMTEYNHTSTHLMHAALRQVLGNHVEQKGSLVNDKYLRFDFSHFEKMTPEQIMEVENLVNEKIRENVSKIEDRNVPIEKAKNSGAMMLFGEKYGDFVRMITFDPNYSVELCGGCHTNQSGDIGLFRIKSESAIAAGVRRIEAVTAQEALDYDNALISELDQVRRLFKNPANAPAQVQGLIDQNKNLEKELQDYKKREGARLADTLVGKFQKIGSYNFLAHTLEGKDVDDAKTLGYSLDQKVENAIILFGLINDKKVNLQMIINRDLVTDQLNAGKIIKSVSKHIKGGGGGQPFYAVAGGGDRSGIDTAFQEVLALIESQN